MYIYIYYIYIYVPGWGDRDHIYIYMVPPPKSPPFLGYFSGQGVPYMYIFSITIYIYICRYIQCPSLQGIGLTEKLKNWIILFEEIWVATPPPCLSGFQFFSLFSLHKVPAAEKLKNWIIWGDLGSNPTSMSVRISVFQFVFITKGSGSRKTEKLNYLRRSRQ